MCSLVLASGLPAFGDESTNGPSLSLPESTTSVPMPKKEGINSVPGAEQVDEMITNANLRAYSGSKSRWSMSNSINYDGGTVSTPFAEGRPNIADASATSTDTDLNDQVNIKYSINALNSILFGVGIRKMAPFTGTGPSASFYRQGGKDMDVYDPILIYQYIYKFIGIQSVAQLQFTQYTRQDIHSASGGNLDKNVQFDQENIYEIGRFALGGSIGFGFNTPTDSSQDYSHYQIWFDPYVEFRLNDTYNLRTVANVWSYEYYPVEKLRHDVYNQSVGVGISVSRDFFLYPNVQFLPGNVAWAYTNVGLTGTLNLF